AAEVLVSGRIAWQIERHFGRFGEIRPAERAAGVGKDDRVFLTPYSSARTIVSWVLGLGTHARLAGPAELTREYRRRLKLLADRHGKTAPGAGAKATPVEAAASRSATPPAAG